MCRGSSRRPSTSQPEREQKLLAACAVCVQEGFWLPLAAEIAELSEDDAEDAADRLVHSSLLRCDLIASGGASSCMRCCANRCGRGRRAMALGNCRNATWLRWSGLFKDWETRWQDCRECLEEMIPAAGFLWERGEGIHGAS